MSSEKYELARDELESIMEIMEKLDGNIEQVEVGQGEVKKRMFHVWSGMRVEAGKALLGMRWKGRPGLHLCSSELKCWPGWRNYQ